MKYRELETNELLEWVEKRRGLKQCGNMTCIHNAGFYFWYKNREKSFDFSLIADLVIF